MGWVMLALIAATTAALLVVLRLPRLLWTFAGAVAMLGAAGYAWQAQPGLAASPVAADAVKMPVPQSYKDMRDMLFGRFGAESAYFAISDLQLAEGDTTFAAGVIAGGLRAIPDDVALWTELGSIIAIHDHGLVSPAAKFAFQRAMALAPKHPGPLYFLGYAYLRGGQLALARLCWMRALALTPPGAEFRPAIAERLAALDQWIHAQPLE